MLSANVLTGLLLTAGAGLAMCAGALLAMCVRSLSARFNSFILGFSAGLMTFLSLFDILPESLHTLSDANPHSGGLITFAAFFGGVVLLALADRIIPASHGHDKSFSNPASESRNPGHSHLKRAGVMLAVFIGIHNFPEGMALFAASIDSMLLAVPLFIGVAIHNVPEGMAVYSPIYISTGSRAKAFLYTLGSALMQPLGAVCAMCVLLPVWTPTLNAIVMSIVAGMMVYISYDELIPGSESHGLHHWSIAGVMSGMLLMSLSIILFHSH